MILTTNRLRLRKFHANDAGNFATLNADPDVMRYFPAPMMCETSDEFLQRIIEYYGSHTDGLLAGDDETGFIGFVGLTSTPYETPFTPCTEIGWRLVPSGWSKGYATEAAAACLCYGFKQ